MALATRLASPFGADLRAALAARAVPRSADDTISVDLIDEDPNQPRKSWDQEALESLAQSLLIVPPGGSQPVGVLQPVGIREAEGGRYLLVYGARRLRAAKLAGLTKIPVRYVRADHAGMTAQVIENQHRASLTNSEVAAAVNAFAAQGMQVGEITKVVNLSRDHVLCYRLVDKLCPAFLAILDRADIFAVAKLHRAWEKADPAWREAYEQAARDYPTSERFSQLAARKIIETAEPGTAAKISESDCDTGIRDDLTDETDRNELPELIKSTSATEAVTSEPDDEVAYEPEEPPVIPLKLPKKVKARVQSAVGRIIDALPASKRRWAWMLVQSELNLTMPKKGAGE